MKFSEFVDKYKVGQSYAAPDGTYKGECVSLVKCYIYDVLGVYPQSIGNAKEYWLKRKGAYIKSLFKPLKKGAEVKRGDVAVRTTGTYGHIMIITKVDKDGFYTIEQNAGGCRVVKHMYHKFEDCYHFLQPLNRENIKEKKNKPALKVGKKYYFTTRPYCYKGFSKDKVYAIGELTKLSSAEKARLKDGTAVKPAEIKEIGGDVWIKFEYNKKPVFAFVYNYDKDKAYVK